MKKSQTHENNRQNSYRIMAKDHVMNNDTWITGLNNNDLVIGPSGAGKTRNYVKPNIMQCNESLIVTDTKNNLCSELEGLLRKNGYKILRLNFTDLLENSCGYNPLSYIRYDKKRQKYVEQDIMKVTASLVPIEIKDDPFWDHAARMVLASIIGYVLECLPKKEHTLEYVAKLLMEMDPEKNNFHTLMEELEMLNPDSFAVQKYRTYRTMSKAEKTTSSILGILAEKLDCVTFDGAIAMFNHSNQIRFADLGKEKTAVFLTVSDTDRSQDKLVNLFYTQALHYLCESADKNYPDHKLKIPVRIILDDFAANACIPDFDKIISVIRSREIYVSIILQSISQLEGLYGHAKAMTIINNCDNCLYLGGQDVETAEYIATKVNKTANTILNLPLNSAFLFTRGSEAKLVEKYDIKEHEKYQELPEARRKVSTKNTTDFDELQAS